MLLCSAFNGLSQRAWLDLRTAGHEVSVHLASDDTPIRTAAATIDPDLIICPFLKDRVPAEVWQRYRTIIIHPGPIGDRGPSSLDWAITDAAATWGVTALQAVEAMDAGPIWATRGFAIGADAPRKSSLYNSAVADAAIDLIREVVAKAADPAFSPRPLEEGDPDIRGKLRPMMRQADRTFSWDNDTAAIVRKIRAADGSPGVRTTVAGVPLTVFDAHHGPRHRREPGTILRISNGAVLIATGDGSAWVGHARRVAEDDPTIKLPAATALADRLQAVPTLLDPRRTVANGYDDITYLRRDHVGVLNFDFYNGAMSTTQCRRLQRAIRRAARQDTRVLLISGGESFSNGIHLNVIEAAADPAAEGWANINAIDDVCKEIITCADQLVVASIAGNAGAGGVMLPLGADRVFVRDGIVLNPHYATMGLFGSEYWTYVLPRRVGDDEAQSLTESCLPISARRAADIGLADAVVNANRHEFEATVFEAASRLATRSDYDKLLADKRDSRETDQRRKPFEAYRTEELGEMSRDLFNDRSGFEQARQAFVFKRRPAATPRRIVAA